MEYNKLGTLTLSTQRISTPGYGRHREKTADACIGRKTHEKCREVRCESAGMHRGSAGMHSGVAGLRRRSAVEVCVLEVRVCAFHVLVCYSHVQICVVEVRVCVEFWVCVVEVWFCVVEVRVCVVEVRVCVTEVRVCVKEVPVCVIEVRVCVIEVRDCVVAARICVVEVRVCLFSHQQLSLGWEEHRGLSWPNRFPHALDPLPVEGLLPVERGLSLAVGFRRLDRDLPGNLLVDVNLHRVVKKLNVLGTGEHPRTLEVGDSRALVDVDAAFGLDGVEQRGERAEHRRLCAAELVDHQHRLLLRRPAGTTHVLYELKGAVTGNESLDVGGCGAFFVDVGVGVFNSQPSRAAEHAHFHLIFAFADQKRPNFRG